MRRRSIDPVADRTAVRRLVDEVVTEYDERAMTSALSPLLDSRMAARRSTTPSPASARCKGISTTLSVEELWINERLTGGLSRAARPGFG